MGNEMSVWSKGVMRRLWTLLGDFESRPIYLSAVGAMQADRSKTHQALISRGNTSWNH